MRFLSFVDYFHGKYVYIMGLKALGKYSDQFWSNEISVLLCEGPKLNIFMISGFLTPGGRPLFIDLKIPNYFKQYKKNAGILENIIILEMEISFFEKCQSIYLFFVFAIFSISMHIFQSHFVKTGTGK